MFKHSKFLLLVVVFIFCGKPNTIINEKEIRNIEITYELIIESTSGELNNVYEINEANKSKFKFQNIPDERIFLSNLKYNETGFFTLKIDNLEIKNICYSPTIEVLNNKATDIVLIQYNHNHNTVGIFGDSIKDIAVSLSEQITDRDSYWVRNDKNYPKNC